MIIIMLIIIIIVIIITIITIITTAVRTGDTKIWKSKWLYLRILEADDIMHEKVKEIVKKENCQGLRMILTSKFNSGNYVTSMDLSTVWLVRYGAENLAKEELRMMDSRTQKILTIN